MLLLHSSSPCMTQQHPALSSSSTITPPTSHQPPAAAPPPPWPAPQTPGTGAGSRQHQHQQHTSAPHQHTTTGDRRQEERASSRMTRMKLWGSTSRARSNSKNGAATTYNLVSKNKTCPLLLKSQDSDFFWLRPRPGNGMFFLLLFPDSFYKKWCLILFVWY